MEETSITYLYHPQYGNMMHAQSCLALCNDMDYSPPGSSVHGDLQAGILEWVAMPSSRGIFLTQDQTCISCVGRQIRYY